MNPARFGRRLLEEEAANNDMVTSTTAENTDSATTAPGEANPEHQMEEAVNMNVTEDTEASQPEAPATVAEPEPQPQPELNENHPFKGMIFALVGSLLFAISAVCVKRLNQHDYMTLTHLFCLFVVIFVPAFFPMQGVCKPAITDWLLMLVVSVFAYVGFLSFIKACQVQNGTGKVLSVLGLPLVGTVCAEMFLHKGGFWNHYWGIIGTIMIVIASVMLTNGEKGTSDNEFEMGDFTVNNNNGLQ